MKTVLLFLVKILLSAYRTTPLNPGKRDSLWALGLRAVLHSPWQCLSTRVRSSQGSSMCPFPPFPPGEPLQRPPSGGWTEAEITLQRLGPVRGCICRGSNGGEAQQGRVEREDETKDARRPAIPALLLTHVRLKESKNSRKLEAYLLT